MRVATYLLTVVVTTVLMMGAVLLLAFQARDLSTGLVVVAAVALVVLVVGPLLLASVLGHRGPRPVSRWWWVGVGLADVVAAVVLVLAVSGSGAPNWVSVVIVGGGALYLLAAPWLGRLIRRAEGPVQVWRNIDVLGPRASRRRLRIIGTTFAVAAVVSVIGLALLVTLLPGGGRHGWLPAAFIAGQLTSTATAVSATIAALPLSRVLRDAADRDPVRLRRVGRVVLRGQDLQLDEEDQRAAAQYAAVVPTAIGYQNTFSALLIAGIAFQLASSLARGDLGAVPAIALGLLVLAAAATVPLTLRRVRNARAYALRHPWVEHPEVTVPQ